jgi:aromatic-L-amino-acid decarboxylase
MTPEEFRRFGHQLIDWIADYRAGLAERPVMAQTTPGAIKASLPAAPPEQGEDFAAVFRDLERVILPGLSHWQHPHFYGYFPANAALASVLGDYLSTGLGVLGLSWQASPALTEVEEVVTDWMRQLVGLSSAWSGVIQDTASTCTLVALLCARERTTDYSLSRGGLQAEAWPLIVYTSDQSHSSVEKAALLAGFGRANVRLIGHDEAYALRPAELEAAIRRDVREGAKPCAIVATTGTTTCGLWRGVEEADSLVFNAHKWPGVAFDCSLSYVRDPEHLVRVLSTNPSYLQSSADGRVKNLRDWGIPLGRRFRALKLWCLLRAEGVLKLQARLRRDLANAQWLAEQVRAAPRWRVLAPVSLQTVCVRHEPPGLEGEALDRHTLAWVERLNRSGAVYLTPAILDGRWMARVSIGAEATERQHVAALWEWMRQEAERC